MHARTALLPCMQGCYRISIRFQAWCVVSKLVEAILFFTVPALCLLYLPIMGHTCGCAAPTACIETCMHPLICAYVSV